MKTNLNRDARKLAVQSTPYEPSLQDCSNKLVEILEIVVADSHKYLMKHPSDVSDKTLREIDFHFVQLGYMMVTLQRYWLDSRSSGVDAIALSEKLDNRIDIKLMNTGKLDLGQLRRIMTRLNKADDISYGLDRIHYHLSYYRNLCGERGLEDQVRHSGLFIDGILSQARAGVSRDIESLQNQINRCNLYYDNLLKGRTFRIAFSSLLISALSFLLSTIGLTLRTEGSFQVLGFPQIFVLITSAVFIALICYLAVQWFER